MQDLYKLANEIRMKYKKVAYVRDNCVQIMTSMDKVIRIHEISELPNMEKIQSMEPHVPDRLKNFDDYVKYIDAAFDEGLIITDMALLLCADRIAETLLIGDCYYYFGVMHIYGKEFKHKLDMYDALPVIKQKNPLTLRDLVLKATQGVYIQDNKAVILDNVAYVAKSYMAYADRPTNLERLKLFGYIHAGEVTWLDVNHDAYIDVKIQGGKVIRILSTLDLNRVDSVLRKRNMVEFTGVRTYPYPIAVLDDGELSYYIKERKINGNIIFRKIAKVSG